MIFDRAQAISMGRAQIDDVRKNTFGSFNLMKLITSGTPVEKKRQPASILKKYNGMGGPLFNEEGLNAFSLVARENQIDPTSDSDLDSSPSFYSAYLLRTYKLPSIYNLRVNHESVIDYNNANQKHKDRIVAFDKSYGKATRLPPIKGTSDIPTWKGIGATVALPVVCDPIEYSDENGKVNILVDGAILFNCPLVVALEEARRMYPNRRFGVILSLGLNRNQDNFAQNAIDIAKKDSPDLHYQRISPPLGKYSSFEKDESKLSKMENEVHNYVMNMKALDKTIHMLFESESRRNTTISRSDDTSPSSRSYIYYMHLFLLVYVVLYEIVLFLCSQKKDRCPSTTFFFLTFLMTMMSVFKIE